MFKLDDIVIDSIKIGNHEIVFNSSQSSTKDSKKYDMQNAMNNLKLMKNLEMQRSKR